MNIREHIQKTSLKLRDSENVNMVDMANDLVELSSLMSSLNKEIGDWQFSYNKLLQENLVKHGKAAQAKIETDASQTYKELNDRRLQSVAVVELIRSIKFRLRASEIEYKENTR